MTTNPIDEIQARADAATEGPWEVDRNYPFSSELVGIFATDAKSYVLKATDDLDDYPVTNGDAVFIAAAREDVPKLVAALRAVDAVCVAFDAGVGLGPGRANEMSHQTKMIRAAIREALG